MSHYIIGTAGHIDHGKTSLTKSLTNIDTDRLQEEKKRDISIELGFAPLILPSGRQVSIIDVPGHERFIRHMVAGVGGIDLVLFVVAADEGVMPQTVEHLHILDLLGISKGIIVLTKTDLVEDDFLELVREDIREAVLHTFLADAPMCETSAATQSGINDLKQTIEKVLSSVPERSSNRPFQLPIDRVFTIKGVGTVITGTVYSGKVHVGDELEVLPDQLKAKVRQIEVHGNEVETAFAGQRAALNLTQIKREQLFRGQVLAVPGHWSPTQRVDAYVRWLPDAPNTKHQSLIKLYVGSKESEAELILYDRPAMSGGEEAFVTLRLTEPVVVSRKDRFIIRRASPATTLGGGEIIQPYARKRKYQPASAEHIQRMYNSSLADRIRDTLSHDPLVRSITDLAQELTESEDIVAQTVANMEEEREVTIDLPRHIALNERLQQKVEESLSWLRRYHEQHPLRQGPSRAEWAARFLPDMPQKTVEALLELWKDQLQTAGESISAKPFQPFIPNSLKAQSEKLMKTIAEQGLQAETWESLTSALHIDAETSTDLLSFFENNDEVVIADSNRAISHEAFEEAKQRVVNFLEQHEQMTMQDAKSLFGLTRKYLVPLMELMDDLGITRREGNVRYLGRSPD